MTEMLNPICTPELSCLASPSTPQRSVMVVRIVSPLLVLSCLTAVCTAQPTEGTTPPPAVVAPNGAPGLVLPEFDAAADPA
ncbi:MAG: hypothetical protein KDA78_05010, partial [Planctomycetaceae bacterium]|nr:hypothetical protein [Planctomycetaceae bacterium]